MHHQDPPPAYMTRKKRNLGKYFFFLLSGGKSAVWYWRINVFLCHIQSIWFTYFPSHAGPGLYGSLRYWEYLLVIDRADTPEAHLYNTMPGGIYHRSINTSASSSSPRLPRLINQPTSPRGSTVQLSSFSLCVCVSIQYMGIVYWHMCLHASGKIPQPHFYFSVLSSYRTKNWKRFWFSLLLWNSFQVQLRGSATGLQG